MESSASGEFPMRLKAYPKMKEVLDRLPPKLLLLSSDGPTKKVDLEDEMVAELAEVEAEASRLERARIEAEATLEQEVERRAAARAKPAHGGAKPAGGPRKIQSAAQLPRMARWPSGAAHVWARSLHCSSSVRGVRWPARARPSPSKWRSR